ncbi:helix-turn-helix transcriptional regulator [Agaribacterium haliotis]|uniref:helix-turn-helix transcriptional regulator n=1 Tax=Agaribacterium haliotis TaxID=2013869 RepID=UPI000BB56DA6|nr:AraC family transcriptional regulator [Agaribacterium haliotis]
MKKNNTYCEPFCIKEGYNFEIHYVSYTEQDPYSCFMHFHEVHELIVFEEIEGSFFYHQGKSELQDNDLVFTPALETHDFECSDRPKSWYIVQFLPSFLEEHGLAQAEAFFKYGMHLRLSEAHKDNIRQVVSWLHESYQADPFSDKSQSLLKLLLAWIAEVATPVKQPHTDSVARPMNDVRLEPILNLFRRNKSVDLSLNEAAELCHLSPSYFSRLFKSVFRYNYSEYSIRHRLYSAARLLCQSDYSVTDVSYELNFSSPSHFIALFKKQFGVTPKKYKKSFVERGSENQALAAEELP